MKLCQKFDAKIFDIFNILIHSVRVKTVFEAPREP